MTALAVAERTSAGGAGVAPLRLLTFSTLYPNAARPSHGIFVRNRLTHLVAGGAAVSTVVAPVPWFPSRSRAFGAWAQDAAAPVRERRDGLDVHHPRYLVIPKVGMTATPALMAHACLPLLRRLVAEGGGFDAIDAHYAYPDGVAAVRLGRALGLPVVITARGTDVNLIPRHAGPRRMLQQAFADAAALVAVSAALKEAMVALGAPDEKVTVLRNGVDTRAFAPAADRAAARAALDLAGPTLISVGHLIERKGHHRTIEALAALPDHTLLLVGDGPERERLAALASRLGVAERTRFLGQRPHHELAGLYSAADASVLASSREGWANVLLESMACGTPVVASNIWGNPEVVRTRAAGVIAAENTPAGIAAGVRDLLSDPPARAATRAYAEAFGWDETTEGQVRLFRRVIGR